MISTRLWRWFGMIVIIGLPSIVQAQVPGAPTNPQPIEGATLSGNQLSWTAGANTTSYDVVLGETDATMKPLTMVDPTATTITIGQSLTIGKTYSWKVTAHNAAGTTPAGPFHFVLSSASPVAIPTTSAGAQTTLQNLGFGVAVSLQWNILDPPIINDASIDANGIVRVNTRGNTTPGFMLEMHYLAKKWNNNLTGFGPFVAVQPGGNSQIISGVGAGGMIDWKVGADATARKGFGLGFGYMAIPSAKTLGDEFTPNKPAPIGPGGTPIPIRFETRDKGALLMILAFTF
jgi:hypothetical protein